MKNINCSFVIPCYNEAPGVLENTISRIEETAGKISGMAFEIIVVNDASKKYTYPEKVRSATVVNHLTNHGYGASLKTGIKTAKYDWIGIIDADGTYPVESFRDMAEHVPHYEMIIGARSWSDISPLRRIPKRFLTRMASYLANYEILDLNSGMRIFRREIYENHRRIYPSRFSFSSTLTMTSIAQLYEIKFHPIEYHKRIGQSAIHPIKDTLRFFYQLLILSLYFNPLRMFVPLSIVLTFTAVLRGIRDFIQTGHLGGICLVLFFLAFQVFFFGLIAEAINKNANR